MGDPIDLENVAKILGVSALSYTLWNIFSDENLTTQDQVYQSVLALLGYMLSEAFGGLAGKKLFPGMAVAAAMIFSFILTILTIEISTTLFTYIDRKYAIFNYVVILNSGSKPNNVRLT